MDLAGIVRGLNNFIASKVFWTEEQVCEYFGLENEDFPSLSFYSDISTWAMLGEEDYPTVLDAKGSLQGGQLVGGQPSDFQNVA